MGWTKEQRKAKRDARLVALSNYKSEKGCSVCGENHPACLDFHVKEYGEYVKGDNPGRLAKNEANWERVEAAIGEYVVLCANCRRKEYWRLGNDPQKIFLNHPEKN